MTNYSTWTDEQLRELATAVISEQEQRRIRREAQARMDEIVAEYEAALVDAPPVPWEDLGDRVGPGERVIWADGETWRNTSGAWLPVTASPETYPLGWAQETGLPGDIPEWTEQGSPTYPAGDLATDAGVIYRCIQTHTAHAGAGWRPSTTPSLWTPRDRRISCPPPAQSPGA